jgi:hypothetical protein
MLRKRRGCRDRLLSDKSLGSSFLLQMQIQAYFGGKWTSVDCLLLLAAVWLCSFHDSAQKCMSILHRVTVCAFANRDYSTISCDVDVRTCQPIHGDISAKMCTKSDEPKYGFGIERFDLGMKSLFEPSKSTSGQWKRSTYTDELLGFFHLFRLIWCCGSILPPILRHVVVFPVPHFPHPIKYSI